MALLFWIFLSSLEPMKLTENQGYSILSCDGIIRVQD